MTHIQLPQQILPVEHREGPAEGVGHPPLLLLPPCETQYPIAPSSLAPSSILPPPPFGSSPLPLRPPFGVVVESTAVSVADRLIGQQETALIHPDTKRTFTLRRSKDPEFASVLTMEVGKNETIAFSGFRSQLGSLGSTETVDPRFVSSKMPGMYELHRTSGKERDTITLAFRSESADGSFEVEIGGKKVVLTKDGPAGGVPRSPEPEAPNVEPIKEAPLPLEDEQIAELKRQEAALRGEITELNSRLGKSQQKVAGLENIVSGAKKQIDIGDKTIKALEQQSTALFRLLLSQAGFQWSEVENAPFIAVPTPGLTHHLYLRQANDGGFEVRYWANALTGGGTLTPWTRVDRDWRNTPLITGSAGSKIPTILGDIVKQHFAERGPQIKAMEGLFSLSEPK